MGKNVSVIIPMIEYDVLFEKSLHSVISQSFLPKEIVIVIDRRTSEKDITYKNKVRKVKLFLESKLNNDSISYKVCTVKSNVGPGGARRIAQINADPEIDWFAFLDSDDYWLPEHLRNFFNWLSEQSGDGNILYFDSYNNVKMPYRKLSFINMLLSPRLHTPSAIMKKSDIYFCQGNYSEDISYWISLMENGYAVYCNNVLGSAGRVNRFVTGQSNNIMKMSYMKVKFLLSTYFFKYPLQVIIGIVYELLIMPTRFIRKS